MGDEDKQDEGQTGTSVKTPAGTEVHEQTPAPDPAPAPAPDPGDGGGDASST